MRPDAPAEGVKPAAYPVLVAEEGEEVHGFMALAFWTAADTGWQAALGFGDYLGIAPARRGRGIGSRLYREGLASLEREAAAREEDLAGMAFDVECPDAAPSSENRRLRERRIAFYERLGARLLADVDFWEPVEAGKPEERFCLGYHPLAYEAESRPLVITLYRLIYGRGEDHQLVRRSLRTDTIT